MKRRAKPAKSTPISCAVCGRKARTPHCEKLLAAGWKATAGGFICASCASQDGS